MSRRAAGSRRERHLVGNANLAGRESPRSDGGRVRYGTVARSLMEAGSDQGPSRDNAPIAPGFAGAGSLGGLAYAGGPSRSTMSNRS